MHNKYEIALSILGLIPIGTTSKEDNALRIQAIGVLKEELEKQEPKAVVANKQKAKSKQKTGE